MAFQKGRGVDPVCLDIVKATLHFTVKGRVIHGVIEMRGVNHEVRGTAETTLKIVEKRVAAHLSK